MKPTRRAILGAGLCAGAGYFIGPARAQETPTWPPSLRGAKNGTVTLRSDRFLEVPDAVAKSRMAEGAAAFTVAKEAPTVDLAFHGNLGPNAIGRRLWSSWGDICVAADGKVASVKLLKSADPAIDPQIPAVLGKWRFRPLLVNNRAVPFCYTTQYEIGQ
jgi:hypothetical protein